MHAAVGQLVGSSYRQYGYAGVGLAVGVESVGIPIPAETTFVAAGIYAGVTHQLSPIMLVVAAVVGGLLGSGLAFVVGAFGGYRLLRRWGGKIHVNEDRIRILHYLFQRRGVWVIVIGRFVAILRSYSSLLAGMSRMSRWMFSLSTIVAVLAWSILYGVGSYELGSTINSVGHVVDYIAIPTVVIAIVALAVVWRKQEARLKAKALAEFPGPLDEVMGF